MINIQNQRLLVYICPTLLQEFKHQLASNRWLTLEVGPLIVFVELHALLVGGLVEPSDDLAADL